MTPHLSEELRPRSRRGSASSRRNDRRMSVDSRAASARSLAWWLTAPVSVRHNYDYDVCPPTPTIRDPLFGAHEFFDPRDLVQVKYEMLRRSTSTVSR
jgi:hypothetical protein